MKKFKNTLLTLKMSIHWLVLVFCYMTRLYSCVCFTDHWFVHVNNLDDLLTDLMNSKGSMEHIYLTVDLALGYLMGRDATGEDPHPIIAWNSKNISDLSLEAFLTTIIATKTLDNAVVKFNFLEQNVIKPTVKILQAKQKLPFKIWLHANVLEGPFESRIDSEYSPIDPSVFFKTVDQFDEKVKVSLGWKQNKTNSSNTKKYEWEHVREMANLVRCINVYHPMNFELQVNLAVNSVEQIKWLLEVIPQSSVELIQGGDEIIYFNTLVELNLALEEYQLYYSLDLKSDQVQTFSQILRTELSGENQTEKEIRSSHALGNWIVRPNRLPSSPASCILSPYIHSSGLMINGGETTFLILNQRYHVPASFAGKMTIMDSLKDYKHSYYVSTLSILAVESKKLPSNLDDITTEKIWSAQRHHYIKKLEHQTKGNKKKGNSTFFFRLSVGDGRCSYIAKTELNATQQSSSCEDKVLSKGNYIVFIIMHDGWSSVVLEDIVFTGLTLNKANIGFLSPVSVFLVVLNTIILFIYK